MFKDEFARFGFAALFLFLIAFNCNTFAEGGGRETPHANVTMISNQDGFTGIEHFIYDKFVTELQKENLFSGNKFDVEFLVDAETIILAGEEKVLVSVTSLLPLPDEVVELNEKSESFFLTVASEKLPDTEEGREVRKYASREFIKQYRMIQNNYLEILDKEEIDDFLSKIIEENISK